MPAALPQSTISYEQLNLPKLSQALNSTTKYLEEPLGSHLITSEDKVTAALRRIKDLEEQLKTITTFKHTITELEGENSKLIAQLNLISKLLTSDKNNDENVELNISESEPQSEGAAARNEGRNNGLSTSTVTYSLFSTIKQQIINFKEQLDDSTRECHNLRVMLEKQKDEINLRDVHIAELKNMIKGLEDIINKRKKEEVKYEDIAVNAEQLPKMAKIGTCNKSCSANISVTSQSGNDNITVSSGETLHKKHNVMLLAETDDTGWMTVPLMLENTTLKIIPEKNLDNRENVISKPLDSCTPQSPINENESGTCELGVTESGITEEQTQADASVGQYVRRIQDLLQEQWTCLENGHPDLASAIKQPASKLSSIQNQLVSSLNVLSSIYSNQTASAKDCTKTKKQQRETVPGSNLKSIMKKKNVNTQMGGSDIPAKKNLQFVGVNGGYETTSSEESSSSEECCDTGKDDSSYLLQVDNVNAETVEKEISEEASESPMAPTSQMLQRCTVSDAFHNECQRLGSHLAELQNTTDSQLRQTLYTVCQEWFRISSQKSSTPDVVAVYLEELRSISHPMLQMVVNIADENGNTALHYSVSHSNFQIVKILLETEVCEVDHQNKAGYTPVMLTVLASAETDEDIEVVLSLLSCGNVNLCATQGGQTSLMLAVSHGRSDMVKVLLNCGADVNQQDEDGESALMMACQLGNSEIVKLLLAQPECDAEITDKVGNTAMTIVAQSAHSDIAEFLQAHTEHKHSHSAAKVDKGAPL
ncbi:hypothetical protein GDO86_007978 [Hymenochirus boettgeri]|uniref:KN motif and ankyrin repeat domain-containing protein 1 n=1 Tax=Hymenochirus boettgeri TaxID=247094 RepID=A0A8T2J344_9PIPI|nr:hypothetical protein GDO86_007978 [Hymenochirus boettgeri]